VRRRNRRSSAETPKADKSPTLETMRYYRRREPLSQLTDLFDMAPSSQHPQRLSPCA
jgi:hypothetical protein